MPQIHLATPLSLAFNIDAKNPDVYAGEKKDFFGYKVLQFTSGTDKGIIVTAPLQLNGSGGVCRPYKNQSNQCFNAEDITVKNETLPVKLLGLSIAADSTSSQFIVCSPSVAHECNDNSYLNSVCYNMTYSLQTTSNFTPAFQECTKKTVDLVFLVDGSGSMTGTEFDKNKDFIVDIMNSLKNTSIKFSAVQFSSNHRTVFDFNDYQDGSALEKTYERTPHGGSDQHTWSPRICVEKYLGKHNCSDRNNGTIEKYDEKQIIRFVIGVKDAKLENSQTLLQNQQTNMPLKSRTTTD
ncbi:unnamed protein product [Pleuronectes platessa]|uniref:VWFA domain-containing protein n=1 Tax=Pleuronectes platessa TaxID=8262 RepID=A0A9N7V904_PLEPL|nr:unnamed protein product [Pleuronectes platessa]